MVYCKRFLKSVLYSLLQTMDYWVISITSISQGMVLPSVPVPAITEKWSVPVGNRKPLTAGVTGSIAIPMLHRAGTATVKNTSMGVGFMHSLLPTAPMTYQYILIFSRHNVMIVLFSYRHSLTLSGSTLILSLETAFWTLHMMLMEFTGSYLIMTPALLLI